jgi:hypothetical protein
MEDAQREYEYDVAFSYASEDAKYVDKVANILKSKSVKVFYDKFEEVNLWGENLFMHFDYVYSKSSRYFIPFISKHYKEKVWASHELSSAFQKVVKQSGYMLPARFDDTEIDGLNSNIGFVDLRTKIEEEFSDIILQKLKFKTDNKKEDAADEESEKVPARDLPAPSKLMDSYKRTLDKLMKMKDE